MEGCEGNIPAHVYVSAMERCAENVPTLMRNKHS